MQLLLMISLSASGAWAGKKGSRAPRALDCLSLIAPQSVAPKEVAQALAFARKYKFPAVHLVTKGKKRTDVVLLGETHGHVPETYREIWQVAQGFETVGTEGVFNTRPWARAVTAIPYSIVMGILSWWRGCGSGIEPLWILPSDIECPASVDEWLNKAVLRMVASSTAQLGPEAEDFEVQLSEFGHLVRSVVPSAEKAGLLRFDAKAILEAWGQIEKTSRLMNAHEVAKEQTRIVSLEMNHFPTFFEELGGAILIYQPMWLIGLAGAGVLGATGLVSEPTALVAGSASMAALGDIYCALFRAVSGKWRDSKSSLSPTHLALLRRDQAMAQSLREHISRHKPRSIFVLTGELHTQRVADLLVPDLTMVQRGNFVRSIHPE